MNKKDYEKPTMRVVQLKQQSQLLAGSVETNRSDYGLANDGVDSGLLDDDGEWLWN